MGSSKIFKCGFDMHDYTDITPSLTEYRKNDFIINADEHSKGNIDNCVWKKHIPSLEEVNSPQFRQREATRILKTGAWACISEEVVWLPPNLYWALNYCPAGSSDMQFRLKRLKHVYFKIRARNNPGCKGTLTIKNRGDGETTMAISDAFWECLDGNTEIGQMGIQSKTRGDAINPCWSYVKTLWQSLAKWIKDDLCSDFASGNNIEEKMVWLRAADESTGQKARNVLMTYYASGTPMDGKHDMKKCILDEICKWEECSFYDTFTNYSKFIMPGFERRGMFDMFSSPADKDGKSNREVHELWKDSNTDEIIETGTTKSRIHRHYSNPLEGIHGAYDKFGDADPQLIYDHIMRERNKLPKDKLLAEIRGFPLNEEEMFGSSDGGNFWDNQKGISARKIYLLGTRFKNEETKEPTVVYGNLEWPEGIKDVSEPVFRQADINKFDVDIARFAISYMPKNREPLKYGNISVRGVDVGVRPFPPVYTETVGGIDSVDKRYPGKAPSNFAMVFHKFRDLYQTGIVKCPTMIYCERPKPIEVAYEDAIKSAIFTRSQLQVESLNTKIVDYFEDRGYIDWMLSKIGQPKNSLIKGDAPGGKTAFLDEIIGLLNGITAIPLDPSDPCLLELNWFYELLDDVSKFNAKDTHANDLSMAWGQALLGAVKLLFQKVREKSQMNTQVLEYLLN